MLVGEHRCDYCREPYAEYGRFTNEDDETHSFCLPECAAAHNRYYSRDGYSDAMRARHATLERRCGRTIACAPPPQNIDPGRVNRADWLPHCRASLCEADAEIARAELLVSAHVKETWRKRH
jgi:hypothetical protein